MPTSDEDLQAKSEEVKKLREQVANVEAERVQRERALANDVTMRQLEAEEAALKARLAVAENRNATIESGEESGPLVSAQEAMERALAQEQAERERRELEEAEAARQAEEARRAANEEGEE